MRTAAHSVPNTTAFLGESKELGNPSWPLYWPDEPEGRAFLFVELTPEFCTITKLGVSFSFSFVFHPLRSAGPSLYLWDLDMFRPDSLPTTRGLDSTIDLADVALKFTRIPPPLFPPALLFPAVTVRHNSKTARCVSNSLVCHLWDILFRFNHASPVFSTYTFVEQAYSVKPHHPMIRSLSGGK